jgi:hypothetical protein
VVAGSVGQLRNPILQPWQNEASCELIPLVVPVCISGRVERIRVSQPEPETESFDAAPLTTVSQAPAKQTAPEAECSHVARRMLERAQSSYDAARFEDALDLAKASQRLLEADGDGRESDRLRARAAWISGLSFAGFGRTEAAVAAFRTALDLDPSLGDQEDLSPKVRTLVESARLASVAAPP